MCRILEAAWQHEPDWRLGQLVANLTRKAGKHDPFHLEDDELERMLIGMVLRAEGPGSSKGGGGQ